VAEVDLSTNGGATFQPASFGSNTWSYAWALGSEDGVVHWLQARAIDQAGNVNLT
jgi:hypothetical protein